MKIRARASLSTLLVLRSARRAIILRFEFTDDISQSLRFECTDKSFHRQDAVHALAIDCVSVV